MPILKKSLCLIKTIRSLIGSPSDVNKVTCTIPVGNLSLGILEV